MFRCMLLSAGLEKVFWAEIVITTTYLINACPSTCLDMNKPKEFYLGHLTKLERLKFFGCVVYAHIRKDKLKSRVVRCMLLKYPEGVKLTSYGV